MSVSLVEQLEALQSKCAEHDHAAYGPRVGAPITTCDRCDFIAELDALIVAAREQATQHSDDLREVAEMAIADYGEAILFSDVGFGFISLPTADSILAEFREKKGVRK